MSILWTIIIGFVAGLIAKFLHPGNKNEPSGFILTTLLGIAGAFVATYLGQALGWYKAGEGAGFIGAIVGAIIVLVLSAFFAKSSRPRSLRPNDNSSSWGTSKRRYRRLRRSAMIDCCVVPDALFGTAHPLVHDWLELGNVPSCDTFRTEQL